MGYPFGDRFLGVSILTELDDELWRKRRAMFNPAFHRVNLNVYLRQFNHQGDVLMEKLRTLADGKTPITMLRYLNRATLDVIANVGILVLKMREKGHLFLIKLKKGCIRIEYQRNQRRDKSVEQVHRRSSGGP